MATPNIQNLDDPAKIASLLRSVVFFGSPLSVDVALHSARINFSITKLYEEGVSRKLTISKIELKSTEPMDYQIFLKVFEESPLIKIETIAGDIKINFKAKIIAVTVDAVTVDVPQEISIIKARFVPRRDIVFSAEGWGCLQNNHEIKPARISLKDYSSSGLGLEVSVLGQLAHDEEYFISGVLTSNKLSMRVENARVLHCKQIFEENPDGWKKYKVGCQFDDKESFKNPHAPDGASERDFRISRRFSLGDSVRLISKLNPGRSYKAEVQDISIRGMSCRLLYKDESSAFPKGAPICLDEINLDGKVVKSHNGCIQIIFDLNEAKSFQSWFLKFTEAFHPTMDTWIDFFNQAAMSFASSGGTTERYLQSASKHTKFLKTDLTTLNKNPHWMQVWVEKDLNGAVIGHVSCTRYGDNLWYVGDLWGSQLSSIHKEFSKRFFESFISYSLACTPFPKTIATWKPDHPYWQNMNQALATEYKHYIWEESLCYKVSLLDNEIFKRYDDCKISIVGPQDRIEISNVLNQLEIQNTRYFVELLGLTVDGFGSPRLQNIIQESGYSFERLYAKIQHRDCSFLAVYSRYPAGTSIQHHQDTVWLFAMGTPNLTKEIFEEISHAAAALSLKLGILPVYIKLATKENLDFLPKAMRLAVADPRMWCLG